MIKEITIKNFKSIHEMKLEVGQFNVLIGENGCGKTNILEAIALGAAAVADKLDNEFLNSRGVRVTGPELMRAAFNTQARDKEIYLEFIGDNDYSKEFFLMNDNRPYSVWKDIRGEKLKEQFPELSKFIIYYPEYTTLRVFEKEGKILPLGIK